MEETEGKTERRGRNRAETRGDTGRTYVGRKRDRKRLKEEEK